MIRDRLFRLSSKSSFPIWPAWPVLYLKDPWCITLLNRMEGGNVDHWRHHADSSGTPARANLGKVQGEWRFNGRCLLYFFYTVHARIRGRNWRKEKHTGLGKSVPHVDTTLDQRNIVQVKECKPQPRIVVWIRLPIRMYIIICKRNIYVIDDNLE